MQKRTRIISESWLTKVSISRLKTKKEKLHSKWSILHSMIFKQIEYGIFSPETIQEYIIAWFNHRLVEKYIEHRNGYHSNESYNEYVNRIIPYYFEHYFFVYIYKGEWGEKMKQVGTELLEEIKNELRLQIKESKN